jgi:hypothetical protein
LLAGRRGLELNDCHVWPLAVEKWMAPIQAVNPSGVNMGISCGFAATDVPGAWFNT